MKDNTNKKVVGVFKEELQLLLMKEFTALNPTIYSYIKATLEELACYHPELYKYDKNNVDKSLMEVNTKKLKGVSKVVVKNEITHEDYNNVIETNEVIKRDVISIRSFNHQIYTNKMTKVALTSYYDKMKMINEIDCVPFGYMEKQ